MTQTKSQRGSGLGFRFEVQDLRFMDIGFRVLGFGSGLLHIGFEILVWSFGIGVRVCCLGFWFLDLRIYCAEL